MDDEDHAFLNNLENIHTLPQEKIQQIIGIYNAQIGIRSRPDIKRSIRDLVLPSFMRNHQRQMQLQRQQADHHPEQIKEKRNRHSEDEPHPKRRRSNPPQPAPVLGGRRSKRIRRNCSRIIKGSKRSKSMKVRR